jgi:hypothetical protein
MMSYFDRPTYNHTRSPDAVRKRNVEKAANIFQTKADVPDEWLMPDEAKKKKIKELENAVERFFLGAFEILDNKLHAQCRIWANHAEWKYRLHIKYQLNSTIREIDEELDMHEIETPQDVVYFVRDKVIEDLANHITKEFCENNKQTLMNISKDVYTP